jgi:hypothetical protein
MTTINSNGRFWGTPGDLLQDEMIKETKAYHINFMCPICNKKRGFPNNHIKCSKILQARYNENKNNIQTK